MRVCLIDGVTMGSEMTTSENAESGLSKVCSDCCKEDESCCAELKKLPDTTLRPGESLVPDLVALDLPEKQFQVSPPLVKQIQCYQAATPIRGPDLPSSRRAVLAVWII